MKETLRATRSARASLQLGRPFGRVRRRVDVVSQDQTKGAHSRSTVYSRSGFQVMVGAAKEVSIVSRSREIERENSMVGGWDANSLSSSSRRIIPRRTSPF